MHLRSATLIGLLAALGCADDNPSRPNTTTGPTGGDLTAGTGTADSGGGPGTGSPTTTGTTTSNGSTTSSGSGADVGDGSSGDESAGVPEEAPPPGDSWLDGGPAGDMAGSVLAGVGDVNGDGTNDLLIAAADSADGDGRVYVLFGSDAISQMGSLTDIGQTVGGFVIQGISGAGERAGASAAIVGDIDGDGNDDIVVGAPEATADMNDDAGRAYVVFGKTTNSAVSLSDIAMGMGGRVLEGENAGDFAGSAVAGGGDVDGDGNADFVIGAKHHDRPGGGANAGRAYLVYGSSSTTSESLADTLSGGGAVALDGEVAFDRVGETVGPLADVNGDGTPDIVVAAPSADPNSNSSGAVYVVFGSDSLTDVDLTDVAMGTGGYLIAGEAAADFAGFALGGGGDFNDDGMADLIIGAPNADPGEASAGRVYVVLGKNDTTAIDLTDVAAGNGGAAWDGGSLGDQAGLSATFVTDADGDGLDDVAIGVPGANPNGSDSGRVYLIYGHATPAGSELSALVGAGKGEDLRGEAAGDRLGLAVAGLGDFNGDGLGDLALASPEAGMDGNGSGRVYLRYGGARSSIAGRSPSRYLAAPSAARDYVNDEVTSPRAVAYTGVGDDVIAVSMLQDVRRIDGGAGVDALKATTPATWDFTAVHGRIRNIERLELVGHGAQRVRLDRRSAAALSSHSNTVWIEAGSEDKVSFADWPGLRQVARDGDAVAWGDGTVTVWISGGGAPQLRTVPGGQ